MIVRLTYLRSKTARLEFVMNALCADVNDAIKMFRERHPFAPDDAITKIEIVDKGTGR